MTKKKLRKKLILTVNLKDLKELNKIAKMQLLVALHKKYPSIVPALKPGTDIVENKLNNLIKLIARRLRLMGEVKSLTAQIHNADEELTDIFVNDWKTQTQSAVKGDEIEATKLGYGYKGQKNVPPPAKNSAPLIAEVELYHNGMHILRIVNNITLSSKLPTGIKEIHVYIQIGGVKPNNFTELKQNGGDIAGIASNGSYTHVDYNNYGNTAYYIAVYIDKKTLKPCAYSDVAKAIFNY